MFQPSGNLLDVDHILGLDGSAFCYRAEDSELGAHGLAKAAVDAASLMLDPRRVVALFIELVGLFQDVVGAKLDAVLAALAAVVNDIHLANDDFMLLRVQGHTPEVHQREIIPAGIRRINQAVVTL